MDQGIQEEQGQGDGSGHSQQRRSAGVERCWVQDESFNFERKRNMPEKYDRNLVAKTVMVLQHVWVQR